MKKYLHVTKEVREHLMKIFGVSSVMVWKALTFESESTLANKIRKAAFENSGILMNELPAMETFHDYDGYMRQYLPNGAMLEFCRNDNSGDVFFKGVKVKHYEQVMFSDIENIQKFASELR